MSKDRLLSKLNTVQDGISRIFEKYPHPEAVIWQGKRTWWDAVGFSLCHEKKHYWLGDHGGILDKIMDMAYWASENYEGSSGIEELDDYFPCWTDPNRTVISGVHFPFCQSEGHASYSIGDHEKEHLRSWYPDVDFSRVITNEHLESFINEPVNGPDGLKDIWKGCLEYLRECIRQSEPWFLEVYANDIGQANIYISPASSVWLVMKLISIADNCLYEVKAEKIKDSFYLIGVPYEVIKKLKGPNIESAVEFVKWATEKL